MAETADNSATYAGIEARPAHLGHLDPRFRGLEGRAGCAESRFSVYAFLDEDAADAPPFGHFKFTLGLLTSLDQPSRRDQQRARLAKDG